MRLAPGVRGWVAVGIAVAVAEVADSRTMSEVFKAASRHPIAGPVVIVFYGTLTAHLFGLIPPEIDPFHQLAIRTFARGRLVLCTCSS